MNWLAFDTSTDVLAIAVSRGERVWAHRSAGGAQASLDGLPTIRRLMDEAGLGWRDLSAIVMGRGPGAFTGLRTACAMAQGLAWGAGLPVLPIDTLLAVAEQARHAHATEPGIDRVLAVNDARMGQVYVAAYEHHADGWHTVAESALLAPEAVQPPDAWQGHAFCLAGNAWTEHGARLLPKAAAPRLSAWPDAQALLRLAPQAWARGQAVPPEQALPLYVRDKVAQTTAEREHARLSA